MFSYKFIFSGFSYLFVDQPGYRSSKIFMKCILFLHLSYYNNQVWNLHQQTWSFCVPVSKHIWFIISRHLPSKVTSSRNIVVVSANTSEFEENLKEMSPGTIIPFNYIFVSIFSINYVKVLFWKSCGSWTYVIVKD